MGKARSSGRATASTNEYEEQTETGGTIPQGITAPPVRSVLLRDVEKDTATGGAMSSQSRKELSTFISASVLPQTASVYSRKWDAWVEFVQGETGGGGPFLTGMREDDKAALVGLMMMREHQGGKRGKGATAFTAAVRHHFARAMCSTTFLDSAIITTARASCLMKPAELRAKKDSGPSESVKLPVCEEILADMRVRLWVDGD